MLIVKFDKYHGTCFRWVGVRIRKTKKYQKFDVLSWYFLSDPPLVERIAFIYLVIGVDRLYFMKLILKSPTM